jgi:hypothetical protein
MKQTILFVFILFAKFSFAQQAIINEIRQKKPGTRELYIFPKIVVTKADTIENKINNLLGSEELALDTITPESKIFEQVWGVDGGPATISNINYRINYNARYILSLSITSEGCGAYCETGTNYYTFNLQTGNRLTLDSFFTKEGISILTDSLNLSKVKKIKAKLRKVSNMLKLKSIQADKDEKKRYSGMLELYTNCLENKIDPEYVKFMFKTNALVIYSDRCSAHYNMSIDDLWIFKYYLSLGRWGKYLTPFGKAFKNK